LSHIFSCSRELPYSAEQMFDLVADIERYPEFLDNWKKTRIVSRDGDSALVEQEMSLAGLTLPLMTRAEFQRPHGVVIVADKGPIVELTIRWTFEPDAAKGCHVRFDVSYGKAPLMLDMVLSLAFGQMGPRIVSAFEWRAHRLYGA
jgi:coenzyme Q-binding protein COQ10